MKRLLIGILIIAVGLAVGYKKLLPFIPENIASKITESIDKVSGKDPQKSVETVFQDIAKKDYQKATENFVPGSRKFYNPEYLKNIYQQAGEIKVSSAQQAEGKALVYFQTENNQSLMANLIKEKDSWLIQDINDDPRVTID